MVCSAAVGAIRAQEQAATIAPRLRRLLRGRYRDHSAAMPRERDARLGLSSLGKARAAVELIVEDFTQDLCRLREPGSERGESMPMWEIAYRLKKLRHLRCKWWAVQGSNL